LFAIQTAAGGAFRENERPADASGLNGSKLMLTTAASNPAAKGGKNVTVIMTEGTSTLATTTSRGFPLSGYCKQPRVIVLNVTLPRVRPAIPQAW
jgi:hypothetical protein